MRKFAIFLVTALVLSLTAAAYAAQTNKYTLTGSTSPTTAGSKKSPRAVGIRFGFTVAEAAGQRPAVVGKYAIKFAGTRVNTSVADRCSTSVLESKGPSGCPAKSIVGTGFIENQTGNTANPNDKSIECNAALSVVNHGANRASIYVQGSPTQSDRRKRCAIELAAPIPARFSNARTGSTLTFTVPQSLRHPGAPTISNAVVKVTSSIKRMTKGGKGFYESIGGCVSRKRTMSVRFTTEAGATTTATKKVACR
jgi:hypothetical protein